MRHKCATTNNSVSYQSSPLRCGVWSDTSLYVRASWSHIKGIYKQIISPISYCSRHNLNKIAIQTPEHLEWAELKVLVIIYCTTLTLREVSLMKCKHCSSRSVTSTVHCKHRTFRCSVCCKGGKINMFCDISFSLNRIICLKS